MSSLSNELLSHLETLSTAAAAKDAQLRYIWMNDAYCQAFDKTSDELLGKTHSEIFQNDFYKERDEKERRALVFGVAQ